ncbi:25556_t:CDS:2 [Gigaspora rosea]|nr:25556_t:CDS:2 [Gigaspora rosea]
MQQNQELVYQHFFNLLNITDKAQFSLQLIANAGFQKINGIMYQKNSNEEKFKWLCPFNSSNNIVEETTTNDAFVKKQLFYENVWDLVCTVMDKQEEVLVRAQEARNNMSFNNFTEQHISTKNIELSTQFKNPRKVFVRERPKSASHHNQISGSANSKKNKKSRKT